GRRDDRRAREGARPRQGPARLGAEQAGTRSARGPLMQRVDVAIVGGGPAGLSAALMLGRCCRSVVVIDAGEHRNRKAQAIHGLLTRDGASPTDVLRVAQQDLLRYPNVKLQTGSVTDVTGARGAFTVHTRDGGTVEARRVLLATGVIDVLPGIE